MSFLLKYSSPKKASLTRLLNTFSTDFAGPLPTTTRGMRILVFRVAHLKAWLLAYSTFSATVSEVGASIKRHIVYISLKSQPHYI